MTNYIEYWADYSGDKRTGEQVANTYAWQGGPRITGVIRYIDAPNLLGTKHTNLTEYRSLLAAGLKVQLVHQGTTTDADSGYQGGVARAQRAKAGADYLGYSGVIYFTNDRPDLPNPAAWKSYLDGAASVLGHDRVGAYGFANALNAAVGHASGFWQAGRESSLVPHADVYQWNNGRIYIAGLEADLNKVIRIYTPGQPKPGPIPTTEDEDYMSIANGGPTEGTNWNVIHVPVNGHRYLRIATSYGNKAKVNATLVDDTPAGAGLNTYTKNLIVSGTADADRPGPWDLASVDGNYANYSHIVIQYQCAGPVTAWVNDRP